MAGYGFNTGLDGHRVQPLTEQDAEEIAGGLKIIYGNARERMLNSVASRIARGVHRFGWAERKTNEVLAAHEQLRRDIERAGKERESLLSGVMERAYLTGNQRFMAEMRSMLGEAAHISPNGIKAGYILADLNNNLNAAERRILRQFDDRYADIIGAVSAEMATGVMNTRQAVGEALQAFADKGITGFIDRGGHHWTLENYAEMAVLTAIERSTISGYVDTMQGYGYDLAYIDGHIGSCPICEAWEGVVISVSGEDSRYPSLSDAENAGCFHPRCMHGISTYYEGISHASSGGFRDEPRPVRDASPQYTARSRQRYAERMAQKYRDRAIVAQTPQQKAQAMNKVREWNAEAERQRSLQFRPAGGNMGMERRTANPKPFDAIPELMSKKRIREIAREYGIPLKGLSFEIHRDPEFLKPSWPGIGSADSMHIGRIDFYPRAFESKEALLRTLYHESLHVQQYKEFGPVYVQNNREYFEQITEDAEEAFITRLREEDRL